LIQSMVSFGFLQFRVIMAAFDGDIIKAFQDW
jgi:hypothetical protein